MYYLQTGKCMQCRQKEQYIECQSVAYEGNWKGISIVAVSKFISIASCFKLFTPSYSSSCKSASLCFRSSRLYLIYSSIFYATTLTVLLLVIFLRFQSLYLDNSAQNYNYSVSAFFYLFVIWVPLYLHITFCCSYFSVSWIWFRFHYFQIPHLLLPLRSSTVIAFSSFIFLINKNISLAMSSA